MKTKLSIVATVAVLLTATSASAQFIRVDFDGNGAYDSTGETLNPNPGPFTSGPVSGLFGYTNIHLETTYGGIDLATPYEWELVGDLSVNIKSNLGNFADTFTLPPTELGSFALGSLLTDAISLYNLTWGAPQPIEIGSTADIFFTGNPLASSDIQILLYEELTGTLGPVNLSNLESLTYTFDGYLQATAVPEPATVGFMAVAGLLGAAVLRRRFKKAA